MPLVYIPMVITPKIELYCLESELAGHFLNTSLLSASEKVRYDSYKYESDAHNFLIARAVLKIKLGEELAIDPQSIVLSVSAMGKPYLENHYKQYLDKGQKLPQFSIAHCDGAVVVAISNEPVGVDVENIRRPREPWRKAERMINPRVAAALKSLSDTEAEYEFARHWTCLEAYVKLLGSSVAKERAEFVLGPRNNDGELLAFLNSLFCMTLFTAQRLCAVAFVRRETEIKQYHWLDTAFTLT